MCDAETALFGITTVHANIEVTIIGGVETIYVAIIAQATQCPFRPTNPKM